MQADTSTHVMLIEDEQNLLHVFVRGLERNDLAVTGFTHPAEAIAALEANPDQFHVVVTDLGLPEIDGIEVARRVRAIRADLPVLLTSGYMAAEDAATATEAGVALILNKPIRAKQLADAIRDLRSG